MTWMGLKHVFKEPQAGAGKRDAFICESTGQVNRLLHSESHFPLLNTEQKNGRVIPGRKTCT
jgi:hypothetical protein